MHDNDAGAGMTAKVDELLTTAQVATRCGQTVSQVHKAIDAGLLTYVHQLPGTRGAYLFDPAAVAAYKATLPARSAID